MSTGNIAKTVVLSSLVTTVMLLGILYTLRDSLVDYFQVNIALPSSSVLQTPTLSEEKSIIAAIEKVNPAVVSIVITKDVPVYERYYETFNPLGLFGGFSVPRVRESGTEEREVGGGSGFIVSNDGLIVTNRHVVEDEEARYSVLLNDGTIYQVDVLARDVQLDIAILEIIGPLEKSLTFVTFGDSEELKLGQTVIVIGNALAEFRNSVSVGVVSGLARSIVASDGQGRTERIDQVIQTDAAINPGNSGGPLLNVAGEVVGVSVATSQGADNIGFALPARLVKNVVDSVQEYGEIVRPFLGVHYVMLNEQLADTNGLDLKYGALVVAGTDKAAEDLLRNSPAARAGIVTGVVILAIDGEELRNVDLLTVLRTKIVGQEVELLIWQEGEEKVVLVTLEKAL